MPYLALIFMLTSWSASALEPRQFIPELRAQPLTIEAENVQLKGYRFLNSRGLPNTGKFVLFTHGLHSNLHEFENLVRAKMSEGYDCYAFNFRGHGNGRERSTVINYSEGDYGFEKMVEVDFPAMLKIAHQFSGQSGYIIGHSMGGMVPRASIAKGLVDQNLIEAMILLGSPPHFRNQFNLLPPSLLDRVLTDLSKGSGQSNFTILNALNGLESDLDKLNFANPMYWLLKSGLTTQWSLLKDLIESLAFHHWSIRALTHDVPKDIMRSFAAFQKAYPYEDVTLDMPVMYVMGDQDVLVNNTDVMSSAKVQSKDAGYWFIELKGVGHLSLIAPAAFESYRDSLKRFMESPSSLGPANQTHIENAMGLCARLLLGS